MKPLLIFLCIVLTLLLGCSKTDIESDTHLKPDYIITVGDTIQIELNSNPTTGYSWEWTNKESVSVVTSSGSEYIPAHVGKAIVGSGGTEIWKFIGVKNGIDTIKLEYCRSWDSESTINVKTIYVKVR